MKKGVWSLLSLQSKNNRSDKLNARYYCLSQDGSRLHFADFIGKSVEIPLMDSLGHHGNSFKYCFYNV